MIRSFVAIEASGGVRSHAIALVKRLRAVPAKVNWVDPENMHWTLKFLGDIELTQTAEICARLNEAVAEVEPFEVEVRGVSAYPSLERPRTIWLGAASGSEQMVALQAIVERELAGLGFAPEGRRFEPHLTIGRVRSSQRIGELGALISQHDSYHGGVVAVDEVVLFSSQLERGGPTYEALCRATLRG